MIVFVDSIDDVSEADLQGFFAGWPNPPSPSTHLRLLNGSDHVVLAREQAGRVVGFITATTDGVLSAYIPLLEVLPEYQGQGIGRELAARMLKTLDEFYMVDLLCDPDIQPFYEKLGMKLAHGMCIRNYGQQSGRKS